MATENQIERKKAKYHAAMEKLRGTTGEPIVKPESYSIDIMNAFNWYSIHTENKVLRKYAISYMKFLKRTELTYCFAEATDFELRQIGIIGRLVMTDQYVSEEHISKISAKMDVLFDKYKKVDVKEVKVSSTPVISIQDRILESALKYAGEIDGHIDEFIKNKSSDFSAKSYLLSNSISGAVSKRIAEYFQPVERELAEALRGTDEQLVEGYSYFTKTQLKKFYDFVKGIIDDCNQQLVNSKSTRSPRARKPVPPLKLVQRLKFMKEYPDLQLKSITPTSIIGASELWVFNTKSRRLTVYKGDLSVKGSSITGYEVAGSNTKLVRKPDEFFKKTDINKKVLNVAFKAINAKMSTPNGRINDDCVLIGVFK
jgi:hypothetical protein